VIYTSLYYDARSEKHQNWVCQFVALGIQHAMRMRHTVMWSIMLYSIFPNYLINGTIFWKKFPEHKMFILIFSATFVWNIANCGKKGARYDKNAYWSSSKVPRMLSPIFMKLEFSWQILEKSSNIKFHENPSSGSRVVSYRRTDMTKLIAPFRNFAKAPKN
jgi:hypothetical protein